MSSLSPACSSSSASPQVQTNVETHFSNRTASQFDESTSTKKKIELRAQEIFTTENTSQEHASLQQLPHVQHNSSQNMPIGALSPFPPTQVKEQYVGGYDSFGQRSGIGLLIANFGVYEGQWANNELTYGMHRALNRTYEGQWSGGHYHGMGKLTFSKGSIYVGHFEKGLMHGNGFITLGESGQTVNGVWKKGVLKHGKKTFDKETLYATYVGSFTQKKMHGLGLLYYKDGSHFSGFLKENAPTSNGTLMLPDGTTYQGEYAINIFRQTHALETITGNGTLTYPNGYYYIGKLINGILSGQGVMHYPNGEEQYRGNWRHNVPHGEGVYTDEQGFRKVGNFVNGVLQGNGLQYNPDGTISYRGDFKDNQFHGQGNHIDAFGIKYDGYWEDGQFLTGHITYLTGDLYTGNFVNQLLEGEGSIKSPLGYVYIGFFINNVPNGIGEEWFPDGTYNSGFFANGLFCPNAPQADQGQEEQGK